MHYVILLNLNITASTGAGDVLVGRFSGTSSAAGGGAAAASAYGCGAGGAGGKNVLSDHYSLGKILCKQSFSTCKSCGSSILQFNFQIAFVLFQLHLF
jgi:hypothetical protein